MIDNKPMEQEALNLIEHRLSKFGFGYAEPNFDEDGGDIFIFDKSHDISKILKVQSKGRSIVNCDSNVVIPRTYVDDKFVCFIYVKTDNVEEENLYMFCQEDILNWNCDGKCYSISINEKFIKESNLKFRFTYERSKCLLNIFDKLSVISYWIDFNQLDLLTWSYDLWHMCNSLPDENLIRAIDTNNNLFIYSSPRGVFFMCMCVLLEDRGPFYGIDWCLPYLQEMAIRYELNKDLIKPTGQRVFSDYAICRRDTYVEEFMYQDNAQLNGFHLHIFDVEDYEGADVYLLRDGRYSLYLTYAKQ